jgi:hypothetical protein
MSKIQISENKLKQIVAESVKNVLNEISSDLAYAAQKKAYDSGRKRQASKFYNYANDKLKTELGADNNGVQMDDDSITYHNYTNETVTLYRDGNVRYKGDFTSIGNYAELQKVLKTDDKPTARLITRWLGKYMSELINNVNPQLLDWHFWAVL